MLEEIKAKWDDIIRSVSEVLELSPLDISYRCWLMPLEPVAFENDTLIVLFKGPEKGTDYVNKKYKYYIQTVIETLFDRRCNISFVTSYTGTDTKKEDMKQRMQQANLNPKYTFDSFVVGSNNQMAHAAAIAIAEAPAEIYNPFFIYGGVGLGKTHLMQAIAHYILQNDPDSRILYVTSEQFTNELIDFIGNRKDRATANFHEKYRNIDVLLIDDIQFIAGKTQTQEEVFHTFNALYEAKKQIIISSDRPPKELNTLEERLRSRFAWGLTADIGEPDYETRMAILRKKEETENYNVDNEIIKYIATNIRSNIRELEGALTKVIAYSRLCNSPLTLEMAQDTLKDHIYQTNNAVTPERIINVVADHYDIKYSDIISDRRNKSFAFPRQVAMYLCCELTTESQAAIGKAFGNKDHTTVIYGRDKIAKESEKDQTLKNTIELLKKKLSPG